MKTLKLFIFMMFISLTRTYAGSVGIGAILGDPTGLSGKYFMGNNAAVDAALSFGNHELIIYADYMKHFPGAFGKQNAFIASLNPYVGVGPVLAFGDGNKDHRHRFIDDDEDRFAFGVRVPFGVEWMSKEIPIGVSLEIAPGLGIIPKTDVFVQGGLAIRYYFK